MYTYPRPQNLAYPARVLSGEGPLSRGDPSADRAESWPDRGAPDRPTDWWPKVERWEAPRPTSLGARGSLAARGGYVNPASKGATSLHPGASRRSIASRGSRGTGKPRTHCAARMRKCGCLKIVDQFVARMERSAIRDKRFSISSPPDCAALHPGYEDSPVSRARCSA
jgi:hypothetical protein